MGRPYSHKDLKRYRAMTRAKDRVNDTLNLGTLSEGLENLRGEEGYIKKSYDYFTGRHCPERLTT